MLNIREAVCTHHDGVHPVSKPRRRSHGAQRSQWADQYRSGSCESPQCRGFGGTPGGTRIPNLLIRSHTASPPTRTGLSQYVMSSMRFSPTPSPLLPACSNAYHADRLQIGCTEGHSIRSLATTFPVVRARLPRRPPRRSINTTGRASLRRCLLVFLNALLAPLA